MRLPLLSVYLGLVPFRFHSRPLHWSVLRPLDALSLLLRLLRLLSRRLLLPLPGHRLSTIGWRSGFGLATSFAA